MDSSQNNLSIGDCCGKGNLYEQCAGCKCYHDPIMKLALQVFPNETCQENPVALGDGYCHDELNTADCNFDNNDCCKNPVFSNVCTKCECRNKESTGYVELERHVQECPYDENIQNNGICNDESNIPECSYDFGECCGAIDLTYCDECQCMDPRNNKPRGKIKNSRNKDTECERFL